MDRPKARLAIGVAGWAALGGALLHAQGAPRSVDLPVAWKVASTHRLELTHEREDFRDDGTVQRMASRTPITVTVLGREKGGGWQLRWRYGRTELLGDLNATLARNPLLMSMISLSDGLVLDFRTNELGTPTELIDPAAVSRFYDDVMEALTEGLRDGGAGEPMLQAIRQGVEPLRNPGTVQAMALREPSLAYLATGGSYSEERTEYEDVLPNPLGGRPFRSRAYFVLDAIEEAAERAVIEWGQTIDPESSSAILRETLQAMAQRMGRDPRELTEQELKIDISDKGRFEFDLRTGWPLLVVVERTIVMGPRKRVERRRFERTRPNED
jgi:hypothetical protein